MSANLDARRTLADWVTLAISILVVGMLVMVAVLEEVQRSHESDFGVAITFDKGLVTQKGVEFYVPYRVTNVGDAAISSAEVWIEVRDAGELLETAEITVSFLPLNGHQDGIYVSRLDPGRFAYSGRLESLLFP